MVESGTRRAKRSSAAKPVDMPENRNSALIHGLSFQIGRLLASSSAPVYPARARLARAPRTEMTFPSGFPTACHQRPRPTTASIKERNENRPNNPSTSEPKDIAEYGLNTGSGKFSLS